nr:MAG: internal scaffolding protein [Microvirus sp.]
MKKIIKHLNGRIQVQTINNEKSRTQQQYKDQCDVNNIISKYQKTGELHHINRRQGVYADMSSITDYHLSLQKVLDANNAFSALPSELRLRFNNNPENLLTFLQNPNNYDEGVKLGLYEPKQSEPQYLKQNETKQTQTNQNETKS